MSEWLARSRKSRWFDPVLAVLLTLPSLVEYAGRPELQSARTLVTVLVLGSMVAFRRTRPLVAAGVQAVVFATTPNLGGDTLPIPSVAVVLVVAYSCGAHAPRGRGLAGALALGVGQQIGMGFSEFPNYEDYFATLVPWWVGRQVARRRALISDLRERTEQLEAEQDTFARLAVRRERARIARELHDIVAHHLAVIVVQSGAGRMAASEEKDTERFAAIRQSGGQALGEMARLVDVLEADKRPGLKRLRVLVDEAAAGGLEVRFTPLVNEVPLPAEVEDVCYRIVQEGLTNAIKHAPGALVLVRLAAQGDEVAIDVRDSGGDQGSALAATGSGMGLSGMRDRVESLGGTFKAGGADGGGWSICARVPLAAAPVPVPPQG
jgi:signal transduction histidine kinase